ncbi:TBC1 domain family member 2A isoform X2 [Phyllopteryx taeniolatus]|uniref:TBC1 domain family member 2A isoform X2 n=1 Tax=Phyllopteryx taeniolatus TaxID=161469 RepID=UPI002AD32035|nr:TBC1 domain family member 2A isoform X2 [Phyllopteryx taeniolatus]
MEQENDSHLCSQSFFQGTGLETDSPFGEQVMNQDEDHQHQKATMRLTSTTPQAPLPAHLDPHQTPNSAHLDPHQAPLPAHLDSHQTPTPAHLDSSQDPLHAHLDPHQTPRSAHLDSHHSPLHAHLDPHQTPTSAHLVHHQAPNSAHLDPQLPAHSDFHPAPTPANLDPQLPAHRDSHQVPLPAHLDPHQTTPSAQVMNKDKDHQSHQKTTMRITSTTPQAPFPAHLDPHQTPNSAHLELYQAPNSSHLDPQLPAHLDSYQALLPAHLESHQTPPPPHLDGHQTPPPAHLPSHQTATPARLDPQLPAHLDHHQTPIAAHLDCLQTASVHLDPHLHVPLNSHQTPLSTHLVIHQAPSPDHLDPYQTPPPAHLDPQLPAHLDPHQTPPFVHLNSHQTLLFTQLDPHQSPTPAHLDFHQAPSTAHLDPLQTHSSVHLDTHQIPPSTYMDPHQTPTTAHLDHQHPAHLNSHQASSPPHLDLHQTPSPDYLGPLRSPPPAHLDPRQTSAPVHLDRDQAPPPAHLDPHQTPLSVHLEGQDTCNFLGSSGEPKLCGFLEKQGGPLRAWKRRWFTYEEKQNQMYYYRTPQDVTPLGRVDLTSATFSYLLKGEMGTFHIETPGRIYTLKAVTQDLMLYWLQQLQLKRWHHQQNQKTSAFPDAADNIADNFLPLLKSPAGLVGEEAANEAPQRTSFGNVSIKHPFIQIQNTVHSLRKRSSQEWAQSLFYVQVPAGVQVDTNAGGPTSMTAPPAGRAAVGGASGALPDTRRRKKNLISSGGTMAASSQSMSRLQRDKEMLMEEVKAQKELVWLLHKTLEVAQRENRTCGDFVAPEGERQRSELLRHRERQEADLLGQSERAQAWAEVAGRDLDQRDLQVAQLRERVRELTETNHAEREVILKLSDHVAACVSSPPSSASSIPDALRQLQQRVEDLRDDIEAYKTQNKFLNSEIFQLTKLWRKSSEQERSLMVKCAYLEAWHCQAESRYLGVLRKLQENRSLDPDQRWTIQKMVEDALQGQANNVKGTTSSLHDEYGFKIIPDYEVEDVKLLAKIQALEIRSHNLLQQEGRERPLLSRWAQYLAGRSDDDFCHSPELKGLLRAGVPQEYRQSVWRSLVQAKTRTARERHPQRYQQLCDKSRTCPHPASRQIQLDLHRTLTSNRNFSSPSSPAHRQLQRILLAFSWQNPSIGYCQGLNRLAAIALVVLQSEEDAFWCVVAVVDAIMPQDYYTKNLLAAQADQYVLKDFLIEKLPRLAAHFDLYGIDVSLVTLNWFLVVFVESLPSDILLPVWDAFLYEGTKVMFRYALALFKYKEDDILKIRGSVDIYQYLRFFTKTITDTRNRRALHLERLLGELRELEEQQKAFAALGGDRADNPMNNEAGEDDEETS